MCILGRAKKRQRKQAKGIEGWGGDGEQRIIIHNK